MKKNTAQLSFFIVFLTALLLSIRNADAVSFYVCPQGSDQWSGRLAEPNKQRTDGPLASLAGARSRIRKLKSRRPLAEPVEVIIAPGRYVLREPVVFTPEDSGTETCPITYKAESDSKPVFTGGRLIEGFQQLGNDIWRSRITGVAAGKWHFEQLFVNGRRRTRARTPDGSYYSILALAEQVLEPGRRTWRPIAKRARRSIKAEPEVIRLLSKLNKRQLNDVVLTVYHNWDVTRRRIDHIDTRTNEIVTFGRGLSPWNPWRVGNRFFLENFRAALDTAGEWFLSRDATLYYKPLPDEDMSIADVVAPAVEKFVIFNGRPEKREFVRHIKLKGLSFRHAQSDLAGRGFEPRQAAANIDAVILADGAQHIEIEDCEIAHIGRYAVWFRKGCRDCKIERCYLHDLGAGGVKIGEQRIRRTEHEQTGRITVENNIIRTGGRILPCAVAVWIGQSGRNTVTHNEICDFYYTAVSAGWEWGYYESLAKRNRIDFNHIHHIGRGVLSDMGGIYVLGESQGTTVCNNVVHDVNAYSYGGWGLYADEGCTDTLFADNLVYRTKDGGFDQHYGRNNLVTNNIFAFASQCQLRRNDKDDQHSSFTFTNNIVYYRTGKVLGGEWTLSNDSWYRLDNNLYFNASGSANMFAGKSFKQWQQAANDVNSIEADPEFVNPAEYDFRLKENSPAFKIGFKPFDYTKAGVYGEQNWVELTNACCR